MGMKELYDKLMDYYNRWNYDGGFWYDDVYIDNDIYTLIDVMEKYEADQELSEIEIDFMQNSLEILDEYYSEVLTQPIITPF